MFSRSGAGRLALPAGTNPPGRCRWQLAVAAKPLVSFLLLLPQAKGAGCFTPCQPRAFPSMARQSPVSSTGRAQAAQTHAGRCHRGSWPQAPSLPPFPACPRAVGAGTVQILAGLLAP